MTTNDSLYVTVTAEGLVVAVNGKDMITLSGDYQNFLECLELADGSKSCQSIISELSQNGRNPADIHEILTFCMDENIIKTTGYSDLRRGQVSLDEYSYTKWDRQIRNFASLPEIDDQQAVTYQKNLEEAHIAILGVAVLLTSPSSSQ
ncbi:hypothetical protein [Paenarthrobacter aurescens]|uniref:hypothetical protein n=1 Tax=Paenarthrobacter aurescens TaxID=43663 RepID=UPI0011422538|nr:hypothetical protein [Paenarthrobacter aurescens]MDO6142690.1 hypothetical protein [Paenarthrobacter aurescens]MDO6146537.1 hypothetical protein [Paenarthrobacter aurescens]MDO6157782.1 hypothetical protein [Paenarthrobacter aurescens]MDO6161767.1 hypothetical protein [Paenarthrobacter aurescens]